MTIYRPTLIVTAIAGLIGLAIIFLVNSFDPFTASMGIKALFVVSLFMEIVCLSFLVIYTIAIMWHEGVNYFFDRYFGPERAFFGPAFRRSFWIGTLTLLFFILNKNNLFGFNFVGGATAIIIIIESLLTNHYKKLLNNS